SRGGGHRGPPNKKSPGLAGRGLLPEKRLQAEADARLDGALGADVDALTQSRDVVFVGDVLEGAKDRQALAELVLGHQVHYGVGGHQATPDAASRVGGDVAAVAGIAVLFAPVVGGEGGTEGPGAVIEGQVADDLGG